MLLLLFVASYSIVSNAKFDPCGEILNSNHYEFVSRATPEPSVSALSRRPEPQSLEATKPGVAQAVLEIMDKHVQSFDAWNHGRPIELWNATSILENLKTIPPALIRIPDRFDLSANDRERFQQTAIEINRLIASTMKLYNRILPKSHKGPAVSMVIRVTQNLLFELMISTFIEGTEFVFHQKALAYYDGGMQSRDRGPEIDIIVKRSDGHDVWLTVKNNSFNWSVREYRAWAQEAGVSPFANIENFHSWFLTSRWFALHERSLGPQLRQQLLVRNKLGLSDTVDLLVITRFQLPAYVYSNMNKQKVESWPLYLVHTTIKRHFFQHLADKKMAN